MGMDLGELSEMYSNDPADQRRVRRALPSGLSIGEHEDLLEKLKSRDDMIALLKAYLQHPSVDGKQRAQMLLLIEQIVVHDRSYGHGNG